MALCRPPGGAPGGAEAVPMGLGPTTSCTLMLARGDALAVALLEGKGFSPSDFQLRHPGGALGKRLLGVADLMHGAEALPLCGPDTVMSEAILVMTAGHFGCVGIVDDSRRLIATTTDAALRRTSNMNI